MGKNEIKKYPVIINNENFTVTIEEKKCFDDYLGYHFYKVVAKIYKGEKKLFSRNVFEKYFLKNDMRKVHSKNGYRDEENEYKYIKNEYDYIGIIRNISEDYKSEFLGKQIEECSYERAKTELNNWDGNCDNFKNGVIL